MLVISLSPYVSDSENQSEFYTVELTQVIMRKRHFSSAF